MQAAGVATFRLLGDTEAPTVLDLLLRFVFEECVSPSVLSLPSPSVLSLPTARATAAHCAQRRAGSELAQLLAARGPTPAPPATTRQLQARGTARVGPPAALLARQHRGADAEAALQCRRLRVSVRFPLPRAPIVLRPARAPLMRASRRTKLRTTRSRCLPWLTCVPARPSAHTVRMARRMHLRVLNFGSNRVCVGAQAVRDPVPARARQPSRRPVRHGVGDGGQVQCRHRQEDL